MHALWDYFHSLIKVDLFHKLVTFFLLTPYFRKLLLFFNLLCKAFAMQTALLCKLFAPCTHVHIYLQSRASPKGRTCTCVRPPVCAQSRWAELNLEAKLLQKATPKGNLFILLAKQVTFEGNFAFNFRVVKALLVNTDGVNQLKRVASTKRFRDANL